MKRLLIFIFVFGAWKVEAQTGNRYWIAFTDKNNSPYSLTAPQAYLSQRAIDRRTRQGIAVDSSDLPVNPWYLDSLVAKGATIRHSSRWLNGATIEVPDTSVLTAIRSLPFVRTSRKTGRISYNRPDLELDKFSLEAGLPGSMLRIDRISNATYGQSYNQIRLHNGDVLHNLGFLGQGMRIAVFDAGFTNVNILSCFDSIFRDNRMIDTYDFVDLNANVYGFDNHGTYVLGCMAGIIPGQLVGTAPLAQYMLYRTENNIQGSENQIEEDNWVAAAERADSAGADVFNTSLSYTTFDDPNMDYTYQDMNGNTARITIASDLAAKKGILVVASAGNYGNSSWTFIGAPADGDSVLAVGATNAEGVRVGFSSQGPTADGRIKPNVMAQGSGAVTCQLAGNGTILVNGTSFSGPIMAGLAAILWQASPMRTNMEIYRALELSGNNALNPNNQVGYGLPDLQVALNSLSNRELEQLRDLVVFPNPFDQHLHISFHQRISSRVEVRLLDIQGREIWRDALGWTPEGPQAFRLEVPQNIKQGIYVLEISSEYARQFSRIIKQ